MWFFKQPFFSQEDHLDIYYAVMTGFRIIFGQENKKKPKMFLFLFSTTIINLPQNLTLDTQDAVSKTFSNFFGKEPEIFGSKSGTDEIKFFPQNLSVDT